MYLNHITTSHSRDIMPDVNFVRIAVQSLIRAKLPAAKVKPFKLLSGWMVSKSSSTASLNVLSLSGA
jgi:hypothetical protein